jgi:hypothetical protein
MHQPELPGALIANRVPHQDLAADPLSQGLRIEVQEDVKEVLPARGQPADDLGDVCGG